MPRPKGVPLDWDELKAKRTLTLTDTAWEKLEAQALALGLPSKSELIERVARGIIPIDTGALNAEDKVAMGKH
ncbi:MAG TPA: hypothetical protein V6D12_21475 [Candidatus Obscuribacterales bacterium]